MTQPRTFEEIDVQIEREAEEGLLDEEHFLALLYQHLMEQVASGAITLGIADEIMQRHRDLLHPEVPTEPRAPRTVEEIIMSAVDPEAWAIEAMEVVEPIPIHRLPYFTAVRNWQVKRARDTQTALDKIAEDALKAQATAQKQYAVQQQEIAQQMAQLPLGRAGTETQQMWLAEQAIRNFQLQGLTAGTHLQPIIRQQIGQLKEAQGKLREQARTKARIATEQAPPTGMTTEQAIAGWQRPGMPTPETGGFQERLAGMPSSMQQYYSGRLGKIWDEFERAFPGARQAWWEALNPAPQLDTGEPGTMAQQFATQFGVPVERAGAMGLRYMEGADRGEFAGLPLGQRQALSWVGAEAAGGEPRMAPAKARDPWELWQERYPYVSKFMAEPPRTRGFYPGRYSPKTRWFS